MVKFLFFFFTVSVTVFAQNQEVEALYFYSDNFTQRDETLLANSQRAFYLLFVNEEKVDSRAKIERNGDVINIYNPEKVTSSNLLFSFANDSKNFTYLKTRMGELIVEDDMPNLVWNISSEKQTIGNLTCRKFSTNYRGRTYEGWYAENVPIPFGPYKFSGLPGLIVQIYSIDGSNISWNLKSIQLNQGKSIPNLDDFKGQRFTLKEIEELQAKERDLRSAKVTSRLGKGLRQTSSKIERLGPEKIYEWELEESEKN